MAEKEIKITFAGGETGGIKFLSGRAGRKNRGGAVEEPSR